MAVTTRTKPKTAPRKTRAKAAAKKGGNAFTRKIGGAPAWVWLVGAGGAIYFYRKYKASQAATAASTASSPGQVYSSGGGFGSGDSGSGSGGGSGTPPPATPSVVIPSAVVTGGGSGGNTSTLTPTTGASVTGTGANRPMTAGGSAVAALELPASSSGTLALEKEGLSPKLAAKYSETPVVALPPAGAPGSGFAVARTAGVTTRATAPVVNAKPAARTAPNSSGTARAGGSSGALGRKALR